MKTKSKLTWLLALSLGAPFAAIAAEKEVILDHSKGSAAVRMDARPGDRLTFRIENTCSEVFNYEVTELQDTEAVQGILGSDCKSESTIDDWLRSNGFCRLGTKTLTSTFASDIGSFVIGIDRKYVSKEDKKVFQALTKEQLELNTPDKSCADVVTEWKNIDSKLTVRDATFSVDVNRVWAVGMSGGLTVSDVVDPRFAIVPDVATMGMMPQNIVVQDSRAQDSASLAFAGFVHLHNRKLQIRGVGFAPTLGFGIDDKNSINAFAGLSVAAGDLGYLTLGYNWREIDRLPSGQQVGQALINDNVLTDLPTRIDHGPFLGFSFKFMAPESSFFKNRIAAPTEESDDNAK